ncbi:ATP-binding protein, partial [[Eubacterium] siraeum]
MTVPVIVEIIFRFIPSALLVFGFIEINLTAKYNKYIQFIAINTVYLFAGLLGQYMREKYKLEFFDFVLAVALVLIYSIFFHTDAVGYRIFIGTLVYLSLIIFDTITTAVIFVIFPEFSFDIGHLTYPALLFADIDLIIYGILMYFEHCIIKRIRDRKSINKRAVIFMLFPESQVLILCVIIKLIMANSDNATAEITYFTLACVVICVISDVLCYRGLIQNSQLYETKMRNEQLEYERSTQYRYYEKINELQHEIMKYRHDFNNVLTTAMNLYTYPDTAEKGKEMLDELSRKNQSNKMPFCCANNIVNAILWDKSNTAKESGVTLNCDASLSNDIPVDDVDLCCLIVNMLDNAI